MVCPALTSRACSPYRPDHAEPGPEPQEQRRQLAWGPGHEGSPPLGAPRLHAGVSLAESRVVLVQRGRTGRGHESEDLREERQVPGGQAPRVSGL